MTKAKLSAYKAQFKAQSGGVAVTGIAALIMAVVSAFVAWFLALDPMWQFVLGVVAVALAIIGVVILVLWIRQSPEKNMRSLIDIIVLFIKLLLEYFKPDFNTLPVAAFAASATSGIAPLTVNFTNQSSNATSYSWSFGDGSTSPAESPQHVFATPGTYVVSLVASNASGTASASKTITVTSPGPGPEPVSEHAPGVVVVKVGNLPIAQIGGEHQVDMAKALAGGQGWPALTVKVMDPQSPNFDVMPNYLWAFWYDGGLAAKGWMISQQGYYYEKDNPAEPTKNCIHSIVDRPWIQPGDPLKWCVRLSDVKDGYYDPALKKYVAVLHSGDRVLMYKKE